MAAIGSKKTVSKVTVTSTPTPPPKETVTITTIPAERLPPPPTHIDIFIPTRLPRPPFLNRGGGGGGSPIPPTGGLSTPEGAVLVTPSGEIVGSAAIPPLISPTSPALTKPPIALIQPSQPQVIGGFDEQRLLGISKQAQIVKQRFFQNNKLIGGEEKKKSKQSKNLESFFETSQGRKIALQKLKEGIPLTDLELFNVRRAIAEFKEVRINEPSIINISSLEKIINEELGKSTIKSEPETISPQLSQQEVPKGFEFFVKNRRGEPEPNIGGLLELPFQKLQEFVSDPLAKYIKETEIDPLKVRLQQKGVPTLQSVEPKKSSLIKNPSISKFLDPRYDISVLSGIEEFTKVDVRGLGIQTFFAPILAPELITGFTTTPRQIIRQTVIEESLSKPDIKFIGKFVGEKGTFAAEADIAGIKIKSITKGKVLIGEEENVQRFLGREISQVTTPQDKITREIILKDIISFPEKLPETAKVVKISKTTFPEIGEVLTKDILEDLIPFESRGFAAERARVLISQKKIEAEGLLNLIDLPPVEIIKKGIIAQQPTRVQTIEELQKSLIAGATKRLEEKTIILRPNDIPIILEEGTIKVSAGRPKLKIQKLETPKLSDIKFIDFPEDFSTEFRVPEIFKSKGSKLSLKFEPTIKGIIEITEEPIEKEILDLSGKFIKVEKIPKEIQQSKQITEILEKNIQKALPISTMEKTIIEEARTKLSDQFIKISSKIEQQGKSVPLRPVLKLSSGKEKSGEKIIFDTIFKQEKTQDIKIKTTAIFKVKTKQEQKTKSKSILSQIDIQLSDLAEKLDTGLKIKTATKTIEKNINKTTPDESITPIIPEFPFTSLKPRIFSFRGGRRPSLSLDQTSKAYTVFLKRLGGFVPVRSGLPRGKALQFGSSRTLKELNRTFKLIESGVTSEADIQFFPQPSQFRRFKQRKGRRESLEPLTFIQRTSTLLKSPEERFLIQEARRQRKILA